MYEVSAGICFITFEFVSGESSTDAAGCCGKMVSGTKVSSAIWLLMDFRDLLSECVRVLQEGLIVSILIHGSDTGEWRKRRAKIRAVHMNSLQIFMRISHIDRVIHAQVKEFCGVKEELGEK